MTKEELFNMYEKMILWLGERTMLDELFNALSSEAIEDNLKYIADNHGLNDLFDD